MEPCLWVFHDDEQGVIQAIFLVHVDKFMLATNASVHAMNNPYVWSMWECGARKTYTKTWRIFRQHH